MSLTTQNHSDIQQRLRKRYLDRLSDRMRKLRKELIERNWQTIRTECRQLRASGDSFGFPEITMLAERVEAMIPEGEISRARNLPEARVAVEKLIATIDTILIANSISRSSSNPLNIPRA